MNVPFAALQTPASPDRLREVIRGPHHEPADATGDSERPGDSGEDDTSVSDVVMYCMCRRGIDSRRAAAFLQGQQGIGAAYDVRGGLNSWREEVDETFPLY